MKKYFVLLSALFINLQVVEACGEIKNFSTNVGTVEKISDYIYEVTVPTGTTSVALNAESDYDFVPGFEPRTVKIDEDARLRVDGEKCGQGIYSYIIKFKTVSSKIAELPSTNETITTNNNETEAQTTTTEGTSTLPYLKSIEIAGFDIDFNKETNNYELTITDNEIKKLEVNAKAENDSDTVVISNNDELKIGENIILITVTNVAAETNTYKIIATKKELSDNNFLASLVVKNATVNFEPDVLEYTINIDKTSLLDINAITQSNLATMEVLNNTNLKSGSVVTIRVTAENGDTKDYKLTVRFNFNIKDYWVYIAIGVGILLLLILLSISSKRKKKKALEVKPTDAGVSAETAGQIQNIVDTPKVEDKPVEKVEQQVNTSNINATLQYISPTDIDKTIVQNTSANPPINQTEVNTDNEVFKL